MDKIKKVMSCEIKQVGEEADRVLRFIGSDETPDRDNDIIELAGWRLDNYQRNPVFLWAHCYDEPPVGKAVNVSKDVATGKLVFDVRFPTADEYPFADTIYKLYKGGYLSATSVGFNGVKFKTRDDDTVLEKPEWQRGKRYMEQELLELSAVPVPCNPNALVSIRSKGFKDEDIDQVFVEEKATNTKTIENDAETIESFIDIALKNWCDKRDGAFKENDIDKIATYEQGNFDALPAECLKAVCYVDAFSCVRNFIDEKSGATVSAKNRKLLEAIHSGFDGNTKQLKEFLDAVMPMNPEDIPENMPMTIPIMNPDDMISAMRTMVASEVKGALENFETQVLSLLPKDAHKVEIDLAAIEFPKAAPNLADIELNIEPEELKNMIANTVREAIIGGMKQ